MIAIVDPNQLNDILATEVRPVIVVCLDIKTDIGKFKTLLSEVTDTCLEEVRICVLDAEYVNVMAKFNIHGTPSASFCHKGKGKDTFLGQMDSDDLVFFLKKNLT
ncbi:hypothetical protein QUF72_04615 [Desulfobacterales bacterium HSG2]|nr:hypothetical protein [Desulfobacterales bacterium HSG2]